MSSAAPICRASPLTGVPDGENALPDPKAEMTDVQVRPNQSDNAITSRINQWAAEMYPVTQKHLDNARALQNATR